MAVTVSQIQDGQGLHPSFIYSRHGPGKGFICMAIFSYLVLSLHSCAPKYLPNARMQLPSLHSLTKTRIQHPELGPVGHCVIFFVDLSLTGGYLGRDD